MKPVWPNASADIRLPHDEVGRIRSQPSARELDGTLEGLRNRVSTSRETSARSAAFCSPWSMVSSTLEPSSARSGAGAVRGTRSVTRAPMPGDQPRSIPASRVEMIDSASDMIRSTSSRQLGTSWIRPTTMPTLHAPASMSPSTITFG